MHLKKTRDSITKNRKEEASKKACESLYENCNDYLSILSFASFGSEITLWPLNKKLAEEKRLVLPYVTSLALQLFLVESVENLQENAWGVLEPNPSICKKIDYQKIEAAFVPALGFDKENYHRIGYGRGYYDRLLPFLVNSVTWGIGYEEQAVSFLPFAANDRAVDKLYLF